MTRIDDSAHMSGGVGTYDVPDVAALLKCSERHIRNLAATNRLPGVIRCGRLLRFHREILNDWLTNQAKGDHSNG